MCTRAGIGGHPLHPMLVPIPIGLWIFSLICGLFSLRRTRARTGKPSLFSRWKAA